MKDSLKKKIEDLSRKAKDNKESHITTNLSSGTESSLKEVIRNKEQADLFMKILKSS